MSYQILTDDDDAYQRTVAYVRERCPEELRAVSPRRHMLAVDDLTYDAMRDLQELGALIVEDVEYAMESAVRR